MEHWKQPNNGRQQQQYYRPEAQHSHRVQQGKTTLTSSLHHNSATKQQQIGKNPIESIANVLNQQSRFVEHQENVQYQSQTVQQAIDSNHSKLDRLDQAHQINIGNHRRGSGGTGKGTSGSCLAKALVPGSANSAVAFSQSSNQVDQGNSYLYAYNDFITYTARTLQQQADTHRLLSNGSGQETKSDGCHTETAGDLCNYLQAPILKPQNCNQHYLAHQESSIDSDEDDALSYILHQHRLRAQFTDQPIQSTVILNNHQNKDESHLRSCFTLKSNNQESNFDADRIDHHLSCSRSSHPRHICGIGRSQKSNLNLIAARLREESQKAFALNQKGRSSSHSLAGNSDSLNEGILHNQLASLDSNLIQSHNFTHDLTEIQDQLATVPNSLAYQDNSNQIGELPVESGAETYARYLNSINNIRPTRSGSGRGAALIAGGGASFLSTSKKDIVTLRDKDHKIINDSISMRDFSRPTTSTAETTAELSGRSTNNLDWLLRCASNLFTPRSNQNSIKQQDTSRYDVNKLNACVNGDKRSASKKKRKDKIISHASEASILTMYSNLQQQDMDAALGQLAGQTGAYYPTQTVSNAAISSGQGSGHRPHQTYASHAQQHHHQYPLSSDSSLSSSMFANSALRMNAFFKSCCSKKCLFGSCLMLILFIFIFVIGLSAYLNFLINLNKTNLSPLSGRLRVESQGDTFNDQLINRTSKEFLAKQQQYETILRGAFDRTQSLLKTYSNHLVKCEVYNFKQGSLWVYFRLFINKKTLLQDTQLMKRKSPDEHFDKQFLPRLTQQTLHSGFEQLTTAFNRNSLSNGVERERSFSDKPPTSGDPLRRQQFVQSSDRQMNILQSQKELVKSFDEQISRLVPIIESIDLQSIIVVPEFDMLQSSSNVQQLLQQSSISDNLRASQFLTTSSSNIMIETGADKSIHEYESLGTTAIPTSSIEDLQNKSTSLLPYVVPPTQRPASEDKSPRAGASDEVSVSTRKFTLYGYKENTTRPTTSIRPRTEQPENVSPFLLNQIQKPSLSSNQQAMRTGASVKPGHKNDANNADTLKQVKIGELISMTKPSDQLERLMSTDEEKSVDKTMSSQQNAREDVKHQRLATNVGESSDKTLLTIDDRTLFTKLQPLNATKIIYGNVTRSFDEPHNSARDRSVDGSVAVTMIAPYQKIDFSTIRANQERVSSHPSDVEELWNKALSNSKKRNSTHSAKIDQSGRNDGGNQPNRLITINTAGETNTSNLPNVHKSNSDSGMDWHNISVLSSDISNTIRAQMQTASLTSKAIPTIKVTSAQKMSAGNPSQQPKISPHLKQGGSLISIPIKQQNPSRMPVIPDHRQITNSSLVELSETKPEKMNNESTFTNLDGRTRNSLLIAHDSPKKNSTKPVNKYTQQKFRKVIEAPHQQILIRNGTISSNRANGTSANNTGIKIVDNFLESLGSRSNQATAQQLNTTINLHLKNKTLKAFNYNADHLAPTQPTTIELTRSTTSSPHSRTTSRSNGDNFDYTTTSSAPQSYITSSLSASRDNPVKVVPVQTLASYAYLDGHLHTSKSHPNVHHQQQGRSSIITSANLSNQWRPIGTNNETSNVPSDVAQANDIQSPTIKPIVDKLSPPSSIPSNTGSQSPFAMSTSILETNAVDKPKPGPDITVGAGVRHTGSGLPNTYQIVRPADMNFNTDSNEFESNRMSRMRQANQMQQEALYVSKSNPSILTTAISNLEAKSKSIVLTTDKVEGSMHSPTLLAPSFLNKSQPTDMDRVSGFQVSSLDLALKRTRGPFAFETLKSSSLPVAPSGYDKLGYSVVSDQMSSQRSERSPQQLDAGSGQKLQKKKLFLGLEEDESDTSSRFDETSGLSIISERMGNTFKSGVRSQMTNDSSYPMEDKIDIHNNFNDSKPFKCQYYGCKARGLTKFICLNHTQICDDFIDCQDESDELDCVSLLKYDSQTNRLSFSNGGGIIYLNRKGSLAPLCIDYFAQTDNRLGTLGSYSASHSTDLNRKQQELIKQINTIGQYACSLQSFSRLVSVKINHHDLVDNLNLIKNSRSYHWLSIVNAGSNHGSYKSENPEHEVEVSTSLDCPSQRTVFVKCGNFECGQDSFSVPESNEVNSTRRKDGVIINDFPWLVKLYWLDSLTCHGYLIDEMWILTSSECFANKSQLAQDLNGWTAETSHEHHGNDDYRSIETNRRSIRKILVQPEDVKSEHLGPAIVLARLEKPVKFSPLNRPICLPHAIVNRTITNGSIYKDCVTATLPIASASTRNLVLSKVEIHKISDCFINVNLGKSDRYDDSVCVSEIAKEDSPNDIKGGDATHVLICSSNQTNLSKPKWTIVGILNRVKSLSLSPNKRLYATVASKIEWIVDTMNPKAYLIQNIDGGKSSANNPDVMNNQMHQNQACNRFKCSSGECLPWARICDGLYDCSSHEDEKDCHK